MDTILNFDILRKRVNNKLHKIIYYSNLFYLNRTNTTNICTGFIWKKNWNIIDKTLVTSLSAQQSLKAQRSHVLHFNGSHTSYKEIIFGWIYI